MFGYCSHYKNSQTSPYTRSIHLSDTSNQIHLWSQQLYHVLPIRISPDCSSSLGNNHIRFQGTLKVSGICLLLLCKDSRLVPSLTPLPCLADGLKIIPVVPPLIQIPHSPFTPISTCNKTEGFVCLQILNSAFSTGVSMEGHWYQNGVKIKMNGRTKFHFFFLMIAYM